MTSLNSQLAIANGTSGKRKRIRKRNKRTTGADVANESDSSSSSSDSEQEESKIPSKKVIQPKKVKVDEKPSSSSSSSSSSSESSDSSSDEEEIKKQDSDEKRRHRKRVRKQKKKESDETSEAVVKTINIESFKTLSDPSKDTRLSEPTSSALAYAKQFALQKDQWKFNKAKQEHLIRHMLSRPQVVAVEEVDTVPTEKEERNDDTTTTQEQASRPSWWPDEWNECVAFYLSTVQGGAKDRLIQRLAQAKEQSIPLPLVESTQSVQEVPTSTETENTNSSKEGNSKSVNFAQMAQTVDSQPSIEEQNERQLERDRIQFEIRRSTDLLKLIKSMNK